MRDTTATLSKSIERQIAYTPVCDLASGGMAHVQLVLRREARFRRLYALKRPRGDLVEDSTLRDMFFEEARIAGLIRHPNVVTLLDVGEDAEGPFLLMDYVDGVSLGKLANFARKRELLLPLQVPLEIGRQVALGLHAAHELRDANGSPLLLVHRDVSPANILVGYDGVVCVTDFGIAKALGRNVDTTAGLLKGKLAYMSPEQLRFSQLDRRSDLFSLGVVLYELLSNQRLYRETHAEQTARRILEEPPPDLTDKRADAPDELIQLLFDLLSKDKHDRPDTAGEVAERLERLLHDVKRDEPSLSLAEFVRDELPDLWREPRARLADQVRRAEEKRDTEPAAADSDAGAIPLWAWVAAAMVLLVAGSAAAFIYASAPDGAPASGPGAAAPPHPVASAPVAASPPAGQSEPADLAPSNWGTTSSAPTAARPTSAAATHVDRAKLDLANTQANGTEESGDQGFLTVRAEGTCAVRVNGRPLGPAPVARVPLPAGTYTIGCKAPGQTLARVTQVEIRQGETTAVALAAATATRPQQRSQARHRVRRRSSTRSDNRRSNLRYRRAYP